MKPILLFAFILCFSGLAHAAGNCDRETQISGAAAIELYASLNLPETQVADEHGGPAFAVAKYGKLIGCQRDLDGSNTQCWVIQPFTGNHCD